MTQDNEKSDLFTALGKRHACRSFDQSREVPEELLEKLIYAAHRAPTGGGAPYRFLVVVKDPVPAKIAEIALTGTLW